MPAPVHKFRFAEQGHLDRENHMFVHCFSTSHPYSVRFLVTVSVICGYEMREFDVTQAYPQIQEDLSRDVYVRLPMELGLATNNFPMLQKALYRLADSGEYRHATLAADVTRQVGMTERTGDPALYTLRTRSGHSGLAGTQVDGFLGTGDILFQPRSMGPEYHFHRKPRTLCTILRKSYRLV